MLLNSYEKMCIIIRKETAFLTAATNWETITPRLKTEKAQKQAEIRARETCQVP